MSIVGSAQKTTPEVRQRVDPPADADLGPGVLYVPADRPGGLSPCRVCGSATSGCASIGGHHYCDGTPLDRAAWVMQRRAPIPLARVIALEMIDRHTPVFGSAGPRLDLHPSGLTAPVGSPVLRAAIIHHLDATGRRASLALADAVAEWIGAEIRMDLELMADLDDAEGRA